MEEILKTMRHKNVHKKSRGKNKFTNKRWTDSELTCGKPEPAGVLHNGVLPVRHDKQNNGDSDTQDACCDAQERDNPLGPQCLRSKARVVSAVNGDTRLQQTDVCGACNKTGKQYAPRPKIIQFLCFHTAAECRCVEAEMQPVAGLM